MSANSSSPRSRLLISYEDPISAQMPANPLLHKFVLVKHFSPQHLLQLLQPALSLLPRPPVRLIRSCLLASTDLENSLEGTFSRIGVESLPSWCLPTRHHTSLRINTQIILHDGMERHCSNCKLAVSSTTVQWHCKGIGSEHKLMSGHSTFEASTIIGGWRGTSSSPRRGV